MPRESKHSATVGPRKNHERRNRASGLRVAVAALGCVAATLGVAATATPAAAATDVAATVSPSPTSSAWCTTFTGERASGGTLEGYTGLSPNLPVCGPSPEFSSSPYADTSVRLPEAYGTSFWSGTLTGFQCVELSDRWLAMAYGLDDLSATNGDAVAKNYYAAYHASHPSMRLIKNGTANSSPQTGDVISFSDDSAFSDADGGHVAVVVPGGSVNSAGNGEIYIAQENIEDLSYTHQELTVSNWTVSGEGFSYLEWLRVAPTTSSTLQVSFQANTGHLYNWLSTTGSGPTTQGMLAGTSPAITSVTDGYERAFQANTGKLIVIGNAMTDATGLAMMAGTSPSIATLPNDGFEVVYQNAAGNLSLFGTARTGALGLGLMRGTSPAIASSGSSYEATFQANTGHLYTWSPTSGTDNTGQIMKAGTSPSITAVTGGYEEAFQASTGDLTVYGAARDANIGLGMMSGTSPAIASSGSSFQTAFQANTGILWTWSSTTGGANLGQGMMAGTSPAITATSAGFEQAFQANTGALVVFGAAQKHNTNLGMMAGTSPSIAS